MNYWCTSCEAHVPPEEALYVLPKYKDSITWQQMIDLEVQCPYCGEHELTSVEGEDERR